jgi:hypothetical protein
MEEMLIEKVRQRTVSCDTKSPDYGDQHMSANALEGKGKELKIKRKFYMSSRDVRIVCPRLKGEQVTGHWRKVHTEKLHGLYCVPDTVRLIKWVGGGMRQGLRRGNLRV